MDAYSADFLDLRDASDDEIAAAARTSGAIVLTKDRGFVEASVRAGSPPMIRVAMGNASTRALKPVLLAELPAALDGIRAGEPIVEIGRDDEIS